MLADTPPPTTTGTTATTTTGDTTTTAQAAVIPDGIVLGGVAVGGLTTDAAAVALQADFGRPLVLVLGHTKIKVAPGQLGMRLPLDSATQRALTVSPGTILGLRAGVDKPSVKAYVARLAKRYDRTVRNPELKLRGLKPYVSKPRVGHVLYQRAISAAIQSEVIHGTREPIVADVEDDQADDRAGDVRPGRRDPAQLEPADALQEHEVRPPLPRRDGSGDLSDAARPLRHRRQVEGPVVVPAERPVGRRREARRRPGPATRSARAGWGSSSPGVGIHGTPESGSIGYSESHGCIRMLIPQAEWLFDHVTVGTTVFILPS